MRVERVEVEHFRGFASLELRAGPHVFLVGQPGAGRSDLAEALWRVLSPDSTRGVLVDDLDFHKRDRSKRIRVEVVLGDLGDDLEQLFLDRLELWDVDQAHVIEQLALDDESEGDGLSWVLRLCYRAEWDEQEQYARQWVDFPKDSDVDAGNFVRAAPSLRERLPFTRIRAGSHVLSLSSRGDLRRMIDAEGGGDLAPALESLLDGVNELSRKLHDSEDLSAVLNRVVAPLRVPLNLGDRSVKDVVRFAPDGGSLAGVLRGLAPTVRLSEELGFLPLERHGSTLSGVFELSRAVAQTQSAESVVVVDDFADVVDPLAATHLASTLRAQASQLWLSTRNGALGEVFRPEEVVRLTISHEGERSAHSIPKPKTKVERAGARGMHQQLLPAVTARAILLVEGVHDRAALQAAALRLHALRGHPLLAARRIAVVDTGGVAQSGGIDAIPKLATFARTLGFFIISLIDWDNDVDDAERRLAAAEAASDVVVRWPQNVAIERALVKGLADGDLRAAVREVASITETRVTFSVDDLSGAALERQVMKFVKSSGGLHSNFIDALPDSVFPPLIEGALEAIREAVGKEGLIQL